MSKEESHGGMFAKSAQHLCHTTSIHVIRWRTVTTIFLTVLVDVQAWKYSNKEKKKWRWLDLHHVTMTRPSRDSASVLLNVSNRLYDSNIIIDKKLFYSWDFFHIRSQLSCRKIENILSHSTDYKYNDTPQGSLQTANWKKMIKWQTPNCFQRHDKFIRKRVIRTRNHKYHKAFVIPHFIYIYKYILNENGERINSIRDC